MSMWDCSNLQLQLEGLAARLRPPHCRFVPVLQIAEELKAKVCIRFDKARPCPTQIELAGPYPTIYLGRRAPHPGDQFLEASEERLLTPRERFSVAHELGHLVALRELDLQPARERTDYWTQEGWMNGFAAALLVAEWLVDEWLDSIPSGQPVSPYQLRRIASEEMRLSEEVIAKRLCQRRPSIGFLKVACVRRRKDHRRLLRVLFAASGDALTLPRTHAHIENEPLLRRLDGENFGSAAAHGFSSGILHEGVQFAWRRAGAGRKLGADPCNSSRPEIDGIHWVSLALQASERSCQLSLW